MTRTEHIKWCKERALAYLNQTPPDLFYAVASMASDLSKHPETNTEIYAMLCNAGTLAAVNGNEAQVRAWVEGFN